MTYKSWLLFIALNIIGVFNNFAYAEYLSAWGNSNVNYLNWSSSTEDRSAGYKNDFAYLELEGGANFSWGELYGFVDFEAQQATPTWDASMAVSSKGKIAVKSNYQELRYYAQSYSTENNDFHLRNTVTGLSYNFYFEQGFITLWSGLHYTNTVGFAGVNGGMLGWVAVYNFNITEHAFSITNWHETEFARSDDYVAINGETKDLSMDGALALWWHVSDSISTGLQYRYAHNKLGQAKTDNALIYTVKYNF